MSPLSLLQMDDDDDETDSISEDSGATLLRTVPTDDDLLLLSLPSDGYRICSQRPSVSLPEVTRPLPPRLILSHILVDVA
jgi:hypothetical protein